MKKPQEWWIKRGENSSGPYTAKELKLAAQQGRVTPESRVRLAGSQEWMVAKDVAGLFPAMAAAPATAVQPNPYASPQAASLQPPVAATPISRHWFVVHATAWVMIAIASLNLLSFAGTALALVMGNVPADKVDSPAGLLVVPLFAALTIAGAIGSLYRRRWGVGLLAVMTFLHCCFVMIFVIGDSFSACWRSFDSQASV
jgi:hypothetical protein